VAAIGITPLPMTSDLGANDSATIRASSNNARVTPCRPPTKSGSHPGSWVAVQLDIGRAARHPGELCPRVGFIVTNLARSAERIVAFYNHRGTCEQWIKEGKGAIKWTRLSCRSFAANAVRLQLHALAYNLGNFMRTLAMPKTAEAWSLTSLREKLIKIGAKVVRQGRYVTFQMAEVAVSGRMFEEILRLIAGLRAPPAPA
jgi:hypothetical protein